MCKIFSQSSDWTTLKKTKKTQLSYCRWQVLVSVTWTIAQGGIFLGDADLANYRCQTTVKSAAGVASEESLERYMGLSPTASMWTSKDPNSVHI